MSNRFGRGVRSSRRGPPRPGALWPDRLPWPLAAPTLFALSGAAWILSWGLGSWGLGRLLLPLTG